MAQRPVVVVGSLNIDMVMNARRLPQPGETVHGDSFAMLPGGKGANQAVAVGRLGYPAALLGTVGSDFFAEQLMQSLRGANVDTGRVARNERHTGVAAVAVESSGVNSIIIAGGANRETSQSYVERHADLLCQAGMVLAQLEIPLETVACIADICRDAGVPFMLDPAPAAPLPEKVLTGLQWFTPNQTEALYYAESLGCRLDDLPAELHRRGVQGVLLKQGAQGVTVAQKGEAPFSVDAFAVESLDTTAAGDAFNGAFAVALLQGNSVFRSAEFACAAAGLCVSRQGAQSSMARREEVEAMLRENRIVRDMGR